MLHRATLGRSERRWPAVSARLEREGSTMPTETARSGNAPFDTPLGTAAIVVAIGPSTQSAAERSGLKVTDVAAEHSLAGIIDQLTAAWRLRTSA